MIRIDIKTSMIAPLLLALAAGGCGTGAERSGSAEVRDSAGIQIVENWAPKWDGGSGWHLSEEPALEIGVLEGDPAYQLFRVADAVRLADGRIVVANAGTYELRFYSAKGDFISSTGREGGGPGEFGGILWLVPLEGDSLMTYDWRNRRVSFFDSKGAFARSFNFQVLAQAGGFPSHIAPFSDGSLLVSTRSSILGPSGQVEGGLRRDSTFFYRFDAQGTVTDTIGKFPGSDVYVKSQDQMILGGVLAFGRAPQVAARQMGFYFGSNDSYEIGYYNAEGVLERLIRTDRTRAPLAPEDIDRFIEERLENAEDDNDRMFVERLFRDMPYPDLLPAYSDFLVDAKGNLWAEEYQRPGEEQPRWTVFAPEGQLLGVVETPHRFNVYQVGPDFVLGRWTDDLDVERVQLYKLIKK